MSPGPVGTVDYTEVRLHKEIDPSLCKYFAAAEACRGLSPAEGWVLRKAQVHRAKCWPESCV